MRPISLLAHRRVASLGFFALLLALFSGTIVSDSRAEAFADPAFYQVWAGSDQAIANNTLNTSWMWGPSPRATVTESYKEAPNGQRLVQYFDKARMEITNPNGDRNSNWFVTNGLLCKELVSGRQQLGNTLFENRSPANVPVGGDLDSPVGPTYATFNSIASLNNDRRVPAKSGFVTGFISRDGSTGTTSINGQRARYAFYENTLGHNVPDVFMNWMNGLGSRGVSWQYALGLPITEPYWASFRIAGAEREVLVQLFERRALTFNPQNDPAWQVEMGNIGLHYMTWLYGNGAPEANPDPFGLDPEEIQVLNLINQYRQSNNLATLSINSTLLQTARWMSQDMATKNYFSHTDSLGRDPFKRMSDFGYRSDTYRGENLGAGYEKADGVMTGWKNSPGHNANLLNPNYRVIGISRVYTANSNYHWYWSTEFGSK